MVRRLRALTKSLSAVRITAIAAIGVSCGSDGITGPSRYGPVDSLVLTPDVRLLTIDGYFPPQSLETQWYPQILEARASDLAQAYLQTFGSSSVDTWSDERGAAISLSELRKCGRVLAAERAYDFLDADPSIALRNVTAGWFLIQYCDSRGTESVLIAVSAGTQADIDGFGELVPGTVDPNSFFTFGIPHDLGGPLNLTPERAAETAHQLTGLRVAALPVLQLSVFPDAPFFARWRVQLEAEALIVGTRSGVSEGVSVVFVGLDDSAFPLIAPRVLRGVGIAMQDEPEDSLPDAGAGGEVTFVRVRLLPGRPKGVEPAIRALP
jgi:hypothetical protein